MLFASGWTLDRVLSLSWQQLATVVSCVLSYKVEQANILTEAVASVFGAKVDRKSGKRKPKKKKNNDRALLSQFAEHGIAIE